MEVKWLLLFLSWGWNGSGNPEVSSPRERRQPLWHFPLEGDCSTPRVTRAQCLFICALWCCVLQGVCKSMKLWWIKRVIKNHSNTDLLKFQREFGAHRGTVHLTSCRASLIGLLRIADGEAAHLWPGGLSVQQHYWLPKAAKQEDGECMVTAATLCPCRAEEKSFKDTGLFSNPCPLTHRRQTPYFYIKTFPLLRATRFSKFFVVCGHIELSLLV